VTLLAPTYQTDVQRCRWTDWVRGEMQRVTAERGCSHVICSFARGTLSREQNMRSLDLFASDVMPAFATG
jgi:hypothetical protein